MENKNQLTPKHVYLLHGWSGVPEGAFRGWLKKELEARGDVVVAPALPDADTPRIETWLPFLQKTVISAPEDTIILGHSMGGALALRYAAALPEGSMLAKIVLVAPVVDEITNMTSDEEKRIARPWLETPIDADKVRRSAKEIIAFFSDNDEFIPLSSEKVMREKFGARTIIEHAMGHYYYEDDSRVFKAPSVLGAMLL